jgi:hypothetical protein
VEYSAPPVYSEFIKTITRIPAISHAPSLIPNPVDAVFLGAGHKFFAQ